MSEMDAEDHEMAEADMAAQVETLPDPVPSLSAGEFERQYAERSGMTVEELRALGKVVRPCECDYEQCGGWQAVSQEYAAEIDDPEKPWAR